jgi:hypothetical protein
MWRKNNPLGAIAMIQIKDLDTNITHISIEEQSKIHGGNIFGSLGGAIGSIGGSIGGIRPSGGGGSLGSIGGAIGGVIRGAVGSIRF